MRYCSTPIGIFDSGVGGLSVLTELDKAAALPDEHYIYFGDTKNLPYGTKTKEEITSFTEDIINFFISRGVQNVIMACNTSSALAYETLVKKFKDITIFPLIQTVCKDIAKYSRIGVMATEGTVKSLTYTKEILKNNPETQVAEIGCSGLVEIVENGLLKEPSSIELVKTKLDTLLGQNVEKIVLGCTHYPYLMPVLEQFAPKEMPKDIFIDPAKYLCEYVKDELIKNYRFGAQGEKSGHKEFYVSGSPERFIESAKLFYDVEKAELVELSSFRNNRYTTL